MSRFRSKVVEIDAVQFSAVRDGDQIAISAGLPADWFVKAWLANEVRSDRKGNCLWVKTLEGTMKASPGDWIIRGTEGELYPCKPSVFERKYEQVVELCEHCAGRGIYIGRELRPGDAFDTPTGPEVEIACQFCNETGRKQ